MGMTPSNNVTHLAVMTLASFMLALAISWPQQVSSAVETPEEAPAEAPAETRAEAPAETPAEASAEAPVETPEEAPAEAAPATPAGTAYIRDTLYVSLRAGPSTWEPILQRGLKSGTKLQRLDRNNTTGYTLVRTENGQQGWIQTQYLVSEPIAADQLAPLQAQLEELQAQQEAALLLLPESDVASNMATQNQQLLENRAVLRARIRSLQQEVSHLSTHLAREWLLLGAGVILTSLLCGFWIGRRIYHRHDDGWA